MNLHLPYVFPWGCLEVWSSVTMLNNKAHPYVFFELCLILNIFTILMHQNYPHVFYELHPNINPNICLTNLDLVVRNEDFHPKSPSSIHANLKWPSGHLEVGFVFMHWIKLSPLLCFTMGAT